MTVMERERRQRVSAINGRSRQAALWSSDRYVEPAKVATLHARIPI
jgi:hypothetical protein